MSLSLFFLQCPTYLVHLTLIVSMMGYSGRTATVLWGVAFRTYSIQLIAFLCICRQAFSPYV